MRRPLIFLLAVFAYAFVSAAEPVGKRVWNDRNFHLYTVMIGVVINEDPKLQSLRVAGVTGRKSDAKKLLDIILPEKYVAAVRKRQSDGKREPTLKDGKVAEKFAYYYFSPEHPDVVITDLSLPLDQQP